VSQIHLQISCPDTARRKVENSSCRIVAADDHNGLNFARRRSALCDIADRNSGGIKIDVLQLSMTICERKVMSRSAPAIPWKAGEILRPALSEIFSTRTGFVVAGLSIRFSCSLTMMVSSDLAADSTTMMFLVSRKVHNSDETERDLR
jgi:hypothetical protein